MRVRVRKATSRDGAAFVGLVTELARFENLKPPSPAGGKRLIADAFGPRPKMEVYVAEVEGTVVAYAITLRTYSSFLAKPTLYLEDLYVTPKARRGGVALAMMQHLARVALKEGCGRIEGIVFDWNQYAHEFYQKTGGQVLSEWWLLRYDAASLRRLARD